MLVAWGFKGVQLSYGMCRRTCGKASNPVHRRAQGLLILLGFCWVCPAKGAARHMPTSTWARYAAASAGTKLTLAGRVCSFCPCIWLQAGGYSKVAVSGLMIHKHEGTSCCHRSDVCVTSATP